MSRAISELTAGTCVYVDETVSGITKHVPYIYLGLDENGNARLLREHCLNDSYKMNSASNIYYPVSSLSLFLNNPPTPAPPSPDDDTPPSPDDDDTPTSSFISRFDNTTLSALVSTNCKFTDYTKSGDATESIQEFSFRCFLLSYSELGFGTAASGSEGQSYLDALKTFYNTTNENTARKATNDRGTSCTWWTRSATSANNYRLVYAYGGIGSSPGHTAYASVRPAIAVAPTTLVSDATAQNIFLLPDGRRTTWDVDMSMAIGGNSSGYYSKVKASVPRSNIANITVQMCNNYNDETPTWETVPIDEAANLGNMTKTADLYRLGIKIHAEANTPDAYIGEPIVAATW